MKRIAAAVLMLSSFACVQAAPVDKKLAIISTAKDEIVETIDGR